MNLVKLLVFLASLLSLIGFGRYLVDIFGEYGLGTILFIWVIFGAFSLVLHGIVDSTVDYVAEIWASLPRDRMTNTEISIMCLGGLMFLIFGLREVWYMFAIGGIILFATLGLATYRCYFGQAKSGRSP